MDQSDRDLAGVPVLDVTTGLDVLHGDLELFQMVDDALPVMLEPVCHQYRLTVGGFDQVFQCLQLVIMQNSRLAVFVIDRTIAHLQQFSSQRCSIGSIYVPVLQGDQEILLEHIVELALLGVHFDFVSCRDAVRHIQVVQSLHGDRNVRDALVDQLLGSLFWLVLEHHAAGWIHGRSLEIGFTVASDELTQTLSSIQNSDLCPKIHKTIGGRCTGQPDPPLHIRTDFSQELKTLRLVVLERGQLVNDHHAEVPAHPIFLVVLHQPLDAFTVDHIDHGRMVDGGNACLHIAHDD